MELKLVDTPVNPKHYHGKPCIACNNTVRWKSTNGCVPCSNAATAQYRRKNWDKHLAHKKAHYAANREHHKRGNKVARIKRLYGLTPEAFEEMKRQQDGKCAICKSTPDKLNVDHCHAHGNVRGLLCTKCNTGIGLLQENTTVLGSAIAYLNRTQKATNAA